MSQTTLRLLFGVTQLPPQPQPGDRILYRRIGGFPLLADFLENVEGETWCQLKDGSRHKLKYCTPESCDQLVQDGIWERI